MDEINLLDFFRYFNGEEQQVAGVKLLAEQLKEWAPGLLQSDSPWVETYRDKAEDKAISVINAAGLDLIKRFEGLRLESYICPAGVLTIGYGSTGEHVYSGQTITEEQAEELLRKDLWRFEDCVSTAVQVPLTDNEYAALVSFTFNCGCGALKTSTLLDRLNAGEPKARVFSEELPRWNKAAGVELEGLTRRRKAEVELALTDSTPEDSPKFTPGSSFAQYITPIFNMGSLRCGKKNGGLYGKISATSL